MKGRVVINEGPGNRNVPGTCCGLCLVRFLWTRSGQRVCPKKTNLSSGRIVLCSATFSRRGCARATDRRSQARRSGPF